MDKILIRDLVARGIIGINDWERENPQEILINITLFVNLDRVCETDDLNDTVNYRTIAKEVLVHAESAGRCTVEALSGDIAKLCLEHPGVLKTIVKVEKPGAVRFSKSVGVEIERSKKFLKSL
jgi:FolB domain-containing protein